MIAAQNGSERCKTEDHRDSLIDLQKEQDYSVSLAYSEWDRWTSSRLFGNAEIIDSSEHLQKERHLDWYWQLSKSVVELDELWTAGELFQTFSV